MKLTIQIPTERSYPLIVLFLPTFLLLFLSEYAREVAFHAGVALSYLIGFYVMISISEKLIRLWYIPYM